MKGVELSLRLALSDFVPGLIVSYVPSLIIRTRRRREPAVPLAGATRYGSSLSMSSFFAVGEPYRVPTLRYGCEGYEGGR